MTQPNKPAVSVIMAAYNAARFLDEAVLSILQQTYRDFELLVMDDGSTDASWKILQEYAEQDQRVRIFQQANSGLSNSLNRLISVAQGMLIARMDADDVSLPTRLEEQFEYMQVHPEVGVLSTGRLIIAPNALAYRSICIPDEHQLIADFLARGINPITHGAVMMRKSLLGSLNEPAYWVIISEDLDLWHRLIDKTTFANLPKPLYHMRRYSGSITYRVGNSKRLINENLDAQKQQVSTSTETKLSELLRPELQKDSGYEHFLNGRALFLHKQYVKALVTFMAACLGRKYLFKSLAFIGLSLLGPLGLFLYIKLRREQHEYATYQCVDLPY